jgi:hypothetical protein
MGEGLAPALFREKAAHEKRAGASLLRPFLSLIGPKAVREIS